MFVEWFTALRLRLRALIHRRQLDRDLEDELAFHLAMKSSKSQIGARQARLAFGNETWFRETCRELWSLGRIEIWWQDLRFALRVLRRSPVFTAVAVLSLALGIGANAAIFSLVNAVMLKTIPVPNPHELRLVNWSGTETSMESFSGNNYRDSAGRSVSGNFPYVLYQRFRDHASGFSDLFAFSRVMTTAFHRGHAANIEGILVSGNFFRGIGVQPSIGRTLLPEDDRPDAPPAAVVTHAWWERYAGLDPKVLGETLTFNGSAFTIIGILPPGYSGPIPGVHTDFYIPVSALHLIRDPGDALTSLDHWWIEIMGRLAPGATDAQAQASLDVLFRQALSTPGLKTKIKNPALQLADGSTGPYAQRRGYVETLRVLLWLVGLVLLIACINLAGLFVARASARKHELAVRRAIGAGRLRLARQSLTESLLVALAGGALGLALANPSKLALLMFLFPQNEPPRFDLAIDARVLGFTLAVSLLTALLFGLAPSSRASRADPAEGLREGSSRASHRPHLGRLLVTAQVALSLLLVAGAGLLARTLMNLRNIDLGFDSENLLVFNLNPYQAGYKDQRLVDYFDRIRLQLAAIPGVRSVTLSDPILVGGAMYGSSFTIPGDPVNPGKKHQAGRMTVGDSYFSTMGIRLTLGRDFTASDNLASPNVVIINQNLARRFFPGANPIGRIMVYGKDEYRIVGVCADTRYYDPVRPAMPIAFTPLRQSRFLRSMHFITRTALPPDSLAAAARRAVTAIDPNIPINSLTTQTRILDRRAARYTTFATLCTALALLALLLSAIELYGLMSYNVDRRTRELGIRMALGARPHDVSRIVWREALLLAVAGAFVGIPAALAATQLIRSYLFGVEPNDPFSLAAAPLVLLTVALLAASVPARRAARLDPMTILRRE
jgi:predicted permease